MGEDKETNASLPEPIIEGETDSRNTHTLREPFHPQTAHPENGSWFQDHLRLKTRQNDSSRGEALLTSSMTMGQAVDTQPFLG